MKRLLPLPGILAIVLADAQAQQVKGSPFYDFEVVSREGDMIDGAAGSPAYPLEVLQLPVSVNSAGEVATSGLLIDPTDGDLLGAVMGWRPGDPAPRYLNGAFPSDFSPSPNSFASVQVNDEGFVSTVDIASVATPLGVPSSYVPPVLGYRVAVYNIDQAGKVSAAGDDPHRVPALPGGAGAGYPEMPGADDLPIIFWQSIANDGSVAFNLHNITNGNFGSPPYGLDRRLYAVGAGATDGGSLVAKELNDASPVMTADGKRLVYRSGTNPGDGLYYHDPSAGGPQLVASLADWDIIGPAPAISDDGSAIVWRGVKDGVDGIWLRVFDPATDALGAIPVITTETPIQFDQNYNAITLTAFSGTGVDRDHRPSRLGIVRHDVGRDGDIRGDSFTLVFPGRPSAASRGNPKASAPFFFSGEIGLWTMRVNVEESRTGSGSYLVNPEGVLPVIQIGDFIGSERITSLHLWDGIANAAKTPRGADRSPFPGDHYLAFWAETIFGTAYAVRAAHMDSEGDGLLDHWERVGGGIDIDRNGTIDLSLADLGATPKQRDLFLEIDWTGERVLDGTTPEIWTNEPNPGPLWAMEAIFAQAPGSPPGVEPVIPAGITLHIDAGPGRDRAGDRFSQNMPDDPALLQGGDLVRTPAGRRPEVVYLGRKRTPRVRAGASEGPFLAFQEAKDRYFGSADRGARELAFRYAILADFNDFIDTLEVVQPDGMTQDVPLVIAHATRGRITTAGGLDGTDDGTDADLPAIATGSTASVIISAPGGVQIRRVALAGYLPNGAVEFDIVGAPLDPVPLPGTNFAFLHTSSGRAEIFFQQDRGDADTANFRTLPGNDFIVSFGTFWERSVFRGTRYVTLGAYLHNTLIHELGHTLGLQHGGIDGCRYRGDQYHSLMSYSHQLRTGFLGRLSKHVTLDPCSDATFDALASVGGSFPALNSFSSGADALHASTGHHDWASIMPGAYRNFLWLGNTSLLVSEGVEAEHVHSDGPPPIDPAMDITGPEVEVTSPAAGDTLALGVPFTVVVTALDPESGIDAVTVSFDVDGDGAIDPAAEIFDAVIGGADTFSAVVPAPAGDAGGREILAAAVNGVGIRSATAPRIWTGPGSSGDTTVAGASITVPSFGGKAVRGFSFELRVSPYEAASVRVEFDANGDGAIDPVAEVFIPTAGQFGAAVAEIGPVAGPLGTRSFDVHLEDSWRNVRTLTRSVEVVDPDLVPPTIVLQQPASDIDVSLGTEVMVSFLADDEVGVSGARGLFDIDGDGDEEVYSAGLPSGGRYAFDLTSQSMSDPPGVHGPEGPRELTIEAFDDWGNRAVASVMLTAIDTKSPDVFIAKPREGEALAFGQHLVVEFTADDEESTALVEATFDVNGDGDTDDLGEVWTPTQIHYGTLHRPQFGPTSGPEGPRLLTVRAIDGSGREAVVQRTIHLGSGGHLVAPDGVAPLALHSSHNLVYEVPKGITVSHVTASFDSDGDGSIGENERVELSETSLAGQFTGSLAVTGGTPGHRDVMIAVTDSTGAHHVTGRTVEVIAAGISGGMLSEAVARIPMMPELHQGGGSAGLFPEEFIATPEHLFFSGTTPGTGRELWRTEGTGAATVLVSDTNGRKSPVGGAWPWRGDGNVFANKRLAAVFNGELYLTLNDGSSLGRQLWKVRSSDGSAEMVRAIGFGGADPEHFAVFKGRLWFTADEGSGTRLWSTDGTDAGTEPEIRVKGPHDVLGELQAAGDYLYFRWYRTELWRTDGTPEGTVLLKDFAGGGAAAGGDLARNFRAFEDKLVFAGHDNVTGRNLWVSDGTPEGTIPLSDPIPGGGGLEPSFVGELGGALFFAQAGETSGRELWKTDGTPEGTFLVRDIHPGISDSSPQPGAVMAGRLFFTADDGTHGAELWSTDGTSAGTALAADIFPGRRSSEPGPPVNYDGRLFFAASHPTAGRELMASDGTPGQTRLVRDLEPGAFRESYIYGLRSLVTSVPYSSRPEGLTVFDGKLFFAAGEPFGRSTSRELWVSDGTAAGTRQLRNIQKRIPSSLDAWNGDLFFSASRGGQGYEPFRFDPDTGEVEQLADLNPDGADSHPSALRDLGPRAIFTQEWLQEVGGTTVTSYYLGATDGTSGGTINLGLMGDHHVVAGPVDGKCYFVYGGAHRELWVTDGTPAGTRVTKEIRPGYLGSQPGYPTPFLNGVAFQANDGTHGAELWFSDGTNAGTFLLKDTKPGSSSGAPALLTAAGDRLFFFAGTAPAPLNWELWSSDGTEAGTARLALVGSPLPLPDRAWNPFTEYLGNYYFAGYSLGEGAELWRTDGTSEGTVQVKVLRPGSFGSRPTDFVAAGSKLFFTAEGSGGRTLWVTDGTSAGTVGGLSGSDPSGLVPLGDGVVLAATSAVAGEELFASDGTSTGSLQVKDIRPGSASSYILELTPLGDEVFFTADDGIHGRELWRSDGTPQGTRMVEDLVAGPGSSSPSHLTVMDGALWYFADDGGDMISLRKLDPIARSPYETWLDRTTTLTGADRDPLADPNANGSTNLYDYGLGVDPSAAGDGRRVVGVRAFEGGSAGIVLRFRRWRDGDARSLTYRVDVSKDLNAWTPVTASQLRVRILDEHFEEVTVSVNAAALGSDRGFLRLAIESGPGL